MFQKCVIKYLDIFQNSMTFCGNIQECRLAQINDYSGRSAHALKRVQRMEIAA